MKRKQRTQPGLIADVRDDSELRTWAKLHSVADHESKTHSARRLRRHGWYQVRATEEATRLVVPLAPGVEVSPKLVGERLPRKHTRRTVGIGSRGD